MGKSPPARSRAVPRPAARSLTAEVRKIVERAKRAVPGETKRDRFLRIGEYRMGEALHKIGLLKPLSGPDYEWTDQEASEMIAALRQAIDEIAEAFTPRPPSAAAKKEVKFTFTPTRRH